MKLFIIWAAFTAVAVLVSWAYTAIFGSVAGRLAKDIPLEESDSATGSWNGRDVAFSFDSAGKQQTPRVALAEIAAISPCRFRACHISRFTLIPSGVLPGTLPQVESALIPDDIEVWCDAEPFVQQILSDPELRERLQITIRSPHDLVEIDRGRIVVATDIQRFDGDYSALASAWNAARTFVERLGPAIPEGGRLPLVSVTVMH